jgi:hypothetical protein
MRREFVHHHGHDYILLFQDQRLAVLEISEGPERLAFLPVLTPLARSIENPLDEDRLQIVDFGDWIFFVDHTNYPVRVIFGETDVRLEQELTPA